MSRTQAVDALTAVATAQGRSPARDRSMASVWAWVTMACILLGSSGVFRAMQDRRHKVEATYTEDCPFPLKSIPQQLGGWKMVEGGDMTLDPLTMRITGGTEHILRTYVDELTGVSLVVLVLFGPAEPVLPHTPEICYPACGYSGATDSADRIIKLEGGKSARFRSSVYSKSGGRSVLREEVCHTFRLEGEWSPEAGSGRKFPRRNPSVFKVQIQRKIAEGERRDKDDPIEQFLSYLIPDMERQIAAGVAKREKQSTLQAAKQASTGGM